MIRSTDQTVEKLNHTIISKDEFNNEIQVELSFKEPETVSAHKSLDKLRVILNERITVQINEYFIYMPRGSIHYYEIPPQLVGFMQDVAKKM